MRFEPECPLCACKPAQLEVGIIVDYLLHRTYVKRPQHGPSPHQICTARRLAQSPPTTTTRHTKTGVCSTPHQKKNHAAPSNETSRTRIHRHNASDVRCEGGVAACALGVAGSWQPSAAGARRRAKVVFFFVGRGQAPPPSAWLSPRHFSPSRVSFMRAFFASRCGFVGGRRLALCDVAERPRGMAPDAASERRWRWGASLPPIL